MSDVSMTVYPGTEAWVIHAAIAWVLQAPKHRQVAQPVVPKESVQADLGPQRMISLVGSLSHFSRPGEASCSANNLGRTPYGFVENPGHIHCMKKQVTPAGDENQHPAGNSLPSSASDRPSVKAGGGAQVGAQAANKAVKRKMPPLVLPDSAPQDSGPASNRPAAGMAGKKRSASDADALTARQLQGAVSARDMQQQLVPWLKSHQQKDQRLQHALAVATPTDPLGKVISRCAASGL